MGSKILVAVDSTESKVLEIVHQVPLWFEEWENTFSRFRPESELSRLNRSNGKPFDASKSLMTLLELAQTMREVTRGAVTPLVLNALIYSGYDVDFDALKAQSRGLDLGHLPVPPDACMFEIDASANRVLLPEGVHVDLGGFVKGWAAHQAMQRLDEFAPCLVNAGGDIAISGQMADGMPWLIGVENPLAPEEHVALIEVGGRGIATSGKDYRRWLVGGEVMHHLIDPWTGMPAVGDVFSATIIAGDVMSAEAAAKAAVILGSARGQAWLDEQPGIAYLLQLENGEIILSSLFESYLWSQDGPKRQECN